MDTLFDTLGNAYEWTLDQRAEYPTQRNDVVKDRLVAAGEVRDNLAPRVVRGGSINDPARNVRLGYRSADLPVRRSPVIGFRVARTLPATP